jgi:hypothetical protein
VISLQLFNAKNKPEWDNFIGIAKNSHFMFFSDYMHYHSDRFSDASLMFYDKNKLIAVFVANEAGSVVYAHQGLTFGGLIMSKNIRMEAVFDCFELMVGHYKQMGKTKLVYKAIPHIYHQYPAEEDLFAITRYNYKLCRRDFSSAICLKNKLSFTESRKSSLRKAVKSQIVIKETNDFKVYWSLLTNVLSTQHGKKPVHTIDEITSLAKIFPDNIKLVAAHSVGNELLAGCVLYINQDVIHTQYMASSDEGKRVGALDLIIDYLINEKYVNKGLFDFGVSTQDDGKVLNNGLVFQKEGFGARGIVHDFYEIAL